MQPFRPTYTQQMTNNKPIWQVPTYFRPNQHKHTPNYNKTQNHQTGHFSENTYPRSLSNDYLLLSRFAF